MLPFFSAAGEFLEIAVAKDEDNGDAKKCDPSPAHEPVSRIHDLQKKAA